MPTSTEALPSRRGPLLRAGAAALVIGVALLAPMAQESPVPTVDVAGPALAPSARVVRVDQPAPAPAPVGLDVPSIGLATSSLVNLELDGDGRLEAPEDFHQAGWFAGGPAPGDPGPAVLVGHVDSYKGPGVFFRVRELRPGAEIRVTRADGSTVRFVVDEVQQYPKDAFPADRVYEGTTDPQLRLITCGGAFDRVARSYLDNIVVFASER